MKRNTVYAVFALALTAALAGKVVAEVDMERSCLEQFRASSAYITCLSVTARQLVDQCSIHAYCQTAGRGYIPAGINASWSDTPKIFNCNGVLRVGPCD